jgi:NAD(P)-dependent dehydrogenase (short-subunit alcohol dehydrogenase family)
VTGILTDKVAIVTGASAGIGRATAKLFAEEGAKVVIGARRRPLLEDLAAEIESDGGSAVALSGDVTDPGFAGTMVDAAVSEFGGLDVAVNNAGTLGPTDAAHRTSVEDWDEAIDLNLNAAFHAVRHQVPAMLERGAGSLVFTSSFVGSTASFPGMAAYAAGKAGLIGLVKTLAVELGPSGVRANALLPGGTNTDMAATFAPTQEALESVASMMALKRIAEPTEIARSALYLASDQSSFTTGTALLVDGGLSINRS